MSSRGYGGGRYGQAGGLRNKKDIVLPAKFTCRICKKTKVTDLFSKREQGLYQSKVMTGGAAAAVNLPLCCRGCAGSPQMEMKCAALCGLWKSLDDFSKSQRLNGEEAKCTMCVDYLLSADPLAQVVTGQTPARVEVPTAQHAVKKVKANVDDESGDDDSGDETEEQAVTSVTGTATSGTVTAGGQVTSTASGTWEQVGSVPANASGRASTSGTGSNNGFGYALQNAPANRNGSARASSGVSRAPGANPNPAAAAVGPARPSGPRPAPNSRYFNPDNLN